MKMRKMNFKNLLLIGFMASTSISFAQIVVDNTTFTPEQLVQDILAGPGVSIGNVTLNGVPVATADPTAGAFDGSNSNIGIDYGVILGSGDVQLAVGPNDNGGAALGGTGLAGVDPDLAAITPNPIFDETILEFDFVPLGDTLSFNYIFASEEYDEYVCGVVNDAFGFFLSGPGIAGPYLNGAENIALIPGTNTPVSINTVNLGVPGTSGIAANCDNIDPNWASYNVFYAGTNAQNSVQYDGWTVRLSANATVQCGETYHIKLAIGDGGDAVFDSGVFLEANSFSSNAIQIAVATVTGDSVIVEGCTDANFIFSRPENDTLDTLIINYDITGDAIMGTDYGNLISPVTFLPGEDTVILNVTAFDDGIAEAPEFITITAYTISTCGDTLVSEGTLWIIDAPDAIFNASVIEGCQPLDVVYTNTSTNGDNFEWIFGDGDTLYVANMDDQMVTYQSSTTATLIAFDQYFCSDTAMIDITVNICGCTDENAENYNPDANVDDGSCIFVYAEVVGPNVFTPNNDGDNDFFTLILKNAVNVEMTILNRWGNVMYEENTDLTLGFPQIGWNGTTPLGIPAEDGTYFYTYSVRGITGDILEGHGFVQLARE